MVTKVFIFLKSFLYFMDRPSTFTKNFLLKAKNPKLFSYFKQQYGTVNKIIKRSLLFIF